MMNARGWRIAFAAALVACTGDGPSPSPEDRPAAGGTAVIVATDNFDYANPLVTSLRYAQEMLRYGLFLPLVQYGPGLSLEPALASAWEMHGDSAVTFTIRRDVRWHDGVPTTALDVAFTFDRVRDARTASPAAERLAGWGDATVIDSFTVRFPVSRPEPLATIALLGIAPRHLLDSIPPERMRQAAFNRAPVGNGPFRFVEYRENDRWVFEANADFPASLGGRPYLDRLVWRIVPDGVAQVAEMQTGNAHIALGTTVEQSVAAVTSADLRLIVRPSRQYGFIGWNGRRPPLDDARVRRAFTLALDRQAMIDALRSGHGTLADGPIGPWHPAWDAELGSLPHAPDSAAALLDAAGVTDRNGDGIRERADGSPLRLSLKIPAANAFNRSLGEMVVADLRAVGIGMALRPLETNTLIGDVTSPARDFDAFLYGWESDFRIDLRNLFHSAELDGPLQFAAYRNPVVDSLIDGLAAEYDPARARASYRRLQRILRDEQPWGFLYFYPDVYLATPRLRGVEMDIRGALVNVQRWWLAGAAASQSVAGGSTK